MENIKPKICSECGYYHNESISCGEAKKTRRVIEMYIEASVVNPASRNA